MDFLRDERVPIVQLDCSAEPEVVWEQLSAVGRLMRQAVGHSNNASTGESAGIYQ